MYTPPPPHSPPLVLHTVSINLVWDTGGMRPIFFTVQVLRLNVSVPREIYECSRLLWGPMLLSGSAS